MARISDAELARLKQEVLLETLARARGYELKKRGKDLALRCPFHEDKTASCIITPSKNVWNCFGCGEGGDVVEWVMKHEGVGFRHAIEILQADPTATAPKTAAKLQCPFDASKPMLDQVADFYGAQLRADDAALTYLDKRGIIEAIEPFGLGAANRTLGLHLPPRNRKEGAELRMRLIECGAYRGNGREHLNGSIVVPFLDDRQQVAEMYGRKYGGRLRKGTARHLYLPGPHKGVLNRSALEDEVVLCEAPIDAMSFYVSGITSVTTSFGTSGITDELFAELIKAKKVHIAFDADEAGDRAAAKLCERLVDRGIVVHRVRLPAGEDANDVLVKQGFSGGASEKAQRQKGKEKLLRTVRQSEWMGGARRQTEPEPAPLAAERLTSGARKRPHQVTDVVEQAPKKAAKSGGQIASEDASKDELTVRFGDRSYRVRGLSKNTVYDVIKINLMVTRKDMLHVDQLDLYLAKPRLQFAKMTSMELSVSLEVAKRDLARLLRLLEEKQSAVIEEKKTKKAVEPMSSEERTEALELLKDPQLLGRVLEDFDALGLVGEKTNKLTGYLAAVSRKLQKPLAVVVQSSSAAGKSSLMDAVLQLVPDEDKVVFSAMTGQSLFYMAGGDLEHKLLGIAEEEGAERASYALKILQSEGRLRIASTGKDPNTGRHVTTEYEVQGPVSIFTTTTDIDVDEELLNRCLVLTVDETDEQTAAIFEGQRDGETLEGLRRSEKKDDIVRRHQNAQRLLEKLKVVNPFAKHLSFPKHQVRLRRDHAKYLALMRTSALLHQHQREVKTTAEGTRYVEVQPQDIALVNRIVERVLSKSLDELAPQTRLVLGKLAAFVGARAEEDKVDLDDVRFTRRDAVNVTNLSAKQLHKHITRLTDLEYLFCERQKHSRVLEYRLLWREGDDGELVLTGLTKARELAKVPPSSPQITPKLPGYYPHISPAKNGAEAHLNGALRPNGASLLENAGILGDDAATSYGDEEGAT